MATGCHFCGGIPGAESQKMLELLLAGFVEIVIKIVPTFTLTMFLHNTLWTPPAMRRSQHFIVVQTVEGFVDIKHFRLQLATARLFNDVLVDELLTALTAKFNTDARAPFGSFLVFAAGLKKDASIWFFSQLSVALGEVLEMSLIGSPAPAAYSSGHADGLGGVIAARLTACQSLVGNQLDGDSESDRNYRVLRYWWAVRELTSPLDIAFLSFDGTTVGRRKQVLLVLSKGSHAMYMPPQVPGFCIPQVRHQPCHCFGLLFVAQKCHLLNRVSAV
jgi:hypothetical protein